MGLYCKKQIVIEAVCWTGENVDEVRNFMGHIDRDAENRVTIATLEGTMKANLGDWIIKGIKGEFYPCKPHIFEELYEAVGNG